MQLWLDGAHWQEGLQQAVKTIVSDMTHYLRLVANNTTSGNVVSEARVKFVYAHVVQLRCAGLQRVSVFDCRCHPSCEGERSTSAPLPLLYISIRVFDFSEESDSTRRRGMALPNPFRDVCHHHSE